MGWTEAFLPNENNSEAVDLIRSAAREAGAEIEEIKMTFKWGEDFGVFTQKYKGAMFGLGSGEKTPALHNPDYDFPDELIATGGAVFVNLLKKQLY